MLWGLVPDIELNLFRQPPGTPVLTWQHPADESPLLLQQCPNLASGQWTDVSVTTPGRYEITDPVGSMFFRL